MDISKEYVLMCERAEEIQDLRKLNNSWKSGSWYYNRLTSNFNVCNQELNMLGGETPSEYIYIPTQDQLQDMVVSSFDISKAAKTALLLSSIDCCSQEYFIMSSCGLIADKKWHPESMEQIWLAFVMKEKYGKEWTGEEWQVK